MEREQILKALSVNEGDWLFDKYTLTTKSMERLIVVFNLAETEHLTSNRWSVVMREHPFNSNYKAGEAYKIDGEDILYLDRHPR